MRPRAAAAAQKLWSEIGADATGAEGCMDYPTCEVCAWVEHA